MNGSDAVIDEDAFVVVEPARVGSPAIDMPGQFEHVVGAAAFRSGEVAFQLSGEQARLRQPSFSVTGTASHIGAPGRDRVEEEVGYVMEAGITRDLIAARRTDNLRDVRIDVQTA